MSDTTSAVGSTYAKYSYEAYLEEQRKPVQSLGKNQFMQLLAAQLQYQDPLEPMKDTDFIAQLAQFSSLEMLESLNATMTAFQSYSLAGKFVYAEVEVDGVKTEVAGTVTRVVMQNGEPYVQVGDYVFKASAIVDVYDQSAFENQLLHYSNLVGRRVSAKTYGEKDEDGNTEIIDVSGVVTRVTIEDGSMVAYLDGSTKVLLINIFDIQQ